MIHYVEGDVVVADRLDVLFPNPVNEHIWLNLDPEDEVTNYSIVNLQGQVLLKRDLKSPDSRIKIQVNDLQVGVYLIKLHNSGYLSVQKFIKL